MTTTSRLRAAALCAAACAVLFAAPSIGAPQAGVTGSLDVRYPRQDSAEIYPVKLLQLALRKSGQPFTLGPLDYGMSQSRALHQLAEGRDVDVMWTITTDARERELLPIRIPIDKGLYGWRVFLVRRAEVERFARIDRLEHLREYRAGQGHDWPDTAILRANGLPVDEAPNYESLFSMLKAGRFDYFPRSVLEVRYETERHAADGLVLEPRLVLQYPTAMYFFVSRNRPELAATIERGLNLAIRDGSFEQLFQQTYGDALRQMQLGKRVRLPLANPLLAKGLPTHRRQLWQQ